MAFLDELKNAWEICRLNAAKIVEVAKNPNATGMAIAFIVIAGVAQAIGGLNPIALFTAPLFGIVGYLVGAGIFHLIAKLFNGQGDFMEMFRAMGYISILSWIMVIPVVGVFLGMIVGIWQLVANIIIVQNVQKLSTGKAAAVVLIPFALIIVLAILGAVMFFGVLNPQVFLPKV